MRLLVAAGAGDVIACDSQGAVHRDRGDAAEDLAWIAENTNSGGRTGGVADVLEGASAFVGLSAPGLLSAADLGRMAADPVVLALAMPDPEILPEEAAGVARVYATGRPDVPNQINSGLASPGIWRGALDCRATEINQAMTLAAATAIAETAAEETRPEPVQRGALDLQPAPGAERRRRRAGGRRGHRRRPRERRRRGRHLGAHRGA